MSLSIYSLLFAIIQGNRTPSGIRPPDRCIVIFSRRETHTYAVTFLSLLQNHPHILTVEKRHKYLIDSSIFPLAAFHGWLSRIALRSLSLCSQPKTGERIGKRNGLEREVGKSVCKGLVDLMLAMLMSTLSSLGGKGTIHLSYPTSGYK